MIKQMSNYPDSAAKLALVAGAVGHQGCKLPLPIGSSAEVAVNERDAGRVIVIGVDVGDFADNQDTRPRGEEGCSPEQVLVTLVDKHGHYLQTEQIREELR